MSARDLKLQVVFAALDRITAPLKKIRDAASPTAKAMKIVSDRLKELNTQQKTIGKFRELSQGLSETSTKLQAAQQRIAGLAQKIKATETPTRAMTREFNAAVKSARALKDASQQQSQQLQVLRDRLSGAGMSTRNLGQHERTLRTDIAATNAQLAEQQKRLAAVAAHQQRVNGARQHAERLNSVAGKVAGAGATATVAGVAMGVPLIKSLQESKHYQTETGRITALGLGEKTSGDAVTFARNMKTYGTSATENMELVRDAMSIFGDLHHAEMVAPTLAKMKFGNKAFYGSESGEENGKKFMDMLKVIELRGGTGSSAAFHGQANMVQKVISATGGRVGPSEWLNFIKTGGIAAKIMDDKSFYYQMEPLVQEVGGHRAGTALASGYSNLYQGKTTKRAVQNMEKLGLIGDTSKVKHDKVGQISTLGPGALLGSDVFRRSQFEWMETILLPQLKKKGITDAKQIEDVIGGLFSNRTAGNQFLDFYRQRKQIHKNAKLNAGAYDIEQINTLGKQQASGKEIEAEAKLANLKLALGEKILPLYIQGLELATIAAQKLTTFMQEHPTLAKAIAVSFGVLAAILLVLGPLMLAMAALIGPYAMLHVLFAKMGISGGVLTPILRGIGSSFMWLGRAALWLGRAFLMNPIGLAVTAIGVSVWAIYTYWGPIKEFFSSLWSGVTAVFNSAWGGIKSFAGGLWTDIKAAFSGGILGVGALILNWSPLGLFYQAFSGVMSWFGIDMPAKFTDFGVNIVTGLINGIKSMGGAAMDAVMSLGGGIIGLFAKKIDSHSPSRVFSAFGGYITQGLALGIDQGQDEPLMQVSSMAKRLTQIGAGIAIGAASMPALAFDTRSPVAPGAAGSGMVVHGDTIQITIQTVPGMDENAIARAVAAALDQRDRQKAARMRSSLHDY